MAENEAGKKNGEAGANVVPKGAERGQRTVSDPEDVAKLVMKQIDTINTRKDDLTVALKQLTDTMRQLTHAYAQQMAVIQGMGKKLKELEEKGGKK